MTRFAHTSHKPSYQHSDELSVQGGVPKKEASEKTFPCRSDNPHGDNYHSDNYHSDNQRGDNPYGESSYQGSLEGGDFERGGFEREGFEQEPADTLETAALTETERFELLSAYIDGEVSDQDRLKVEQWLASDADIQRKYKAQLKLSQALKSLFS